MSDHEWRVSDHERSDGQGDDVVGYVERVAGVYEITRIGAPLERSYRDSLMAAIDSLIEEDTAHPIRAGAHEMRRPR